MIAGKTASEILLMPKWTRTRWYTKISPEEKEDAMRIVESARRVKHNESMIGKNNYFFGSCRTGEKNPMYGKTHTPATKAKLSADKMGKKCPQHSERMRGENNPMYGKIGGENNPMSRPEVIAKCSGKNNHNWQGGVSFEPYGLEFNDELKRQIRARDNHTCQECRRTEEQLYCTLDVHHIDYDKKNNAIENLISLCRSCHAQTGFNREDWTEYFGGLIK